MKLKAIGALFIIVASVQSQTGPAFELATIKPSSPEARGKSFSFMGARHWIVNNHTLRECIAYAYTTTGGRVYGGPSWIDSDRYDIVMLEPEDIRPSAEQNLLMFQNLLADRFRLRIHRETKQMSIYNLVISKNGAKLAESTSGKTSMMFQSAQSSPGGMLLPARRATMEILAANLGRVVLDRPVIDKTGLTGTYDFDLEFSAEGTLFAPSGPQPSGTELGNLPDIFTAIQHLGLKLESAKGPVETIVIDSIERPGDN